ncbi:MAG: hypothetical protein M3169_17125 [Candidatus Eremiobacteraeota bacterium]|nr:hypothetical protein [Candidatus Eremiobacteraeota bacterium]
MKCGRLAGSCVFAVSLVLVGGRASFAQSTTTVQGTPPPSADADVVLDADVHIQSVRYTVVPKNAKVKVSGVNQVGGYTITRTNLPAHPKAGVTYRNVRIQLHAASRFVDPANSHASPSPAPAAPH